MTNQEAAENLKKEVENYFSQQRYNGWSLTESRVITTRNKVVYKYYFEGKSTNVAYYKYPFISIDQLNRVRIGFDTIFNDPTFLNEKLRDEVISKILEIENKLNIPIINCGFGYREDSNKLDSICFDVDLEGLEQPYMEKIINFIELAYSIYAQNYKNIKTLKSIESKLEDLEEIFKSKLQSIKREIKEINEFLNPNLIKK